MRGRLTLLVVLMLLALAPPPASADGGICVDPYASDPSLVVYVGSCSLVTVVDFGFTVNPGGNPGATVWLVVEVLGETHEFVWHCSTYVTTPTITGNGEIDWWITTDAINCWLPEVS